MPPPERNPQPFAASFTVAGRPREVSQLAMAVESDLGAAGWTLADSQRGRSPRRVTRMHRNDEWLTLVVADPSPDRLSGPHQYELVVSALVHDREALREIVRSFPLT